MKNDMGLIVLLAREYTVFSLLFLYFQHSDQKQFFVEYLPQVSWSVLYETILALL